jgi:membrane-bound lytic murein transglycosylase A
MKRSFPLFLIILLLGGLTLLGLLLPRKVVDDVADDVDVPPAAEGLTLAPVGFADLPGWSRDDHAAALSTFLVSCKRLAPQPADRGMGGAGFAGTLGDWQPVCEQANAVPANDPAAARVFFESTFTPFTIRDGEDEDGLFTGYYVPVIEGRRAPDAHFNVPLHGRPADLISVNLGAFRSSLKGQSIDGMINGNRLVPYHARDHIVGGVLDDRSLEIMWLDDPVDAFFMQIQGSGMIRLEDGSVVRLGFAGKNGHNYTSVGQVLVDRGEMTLDQASMQSIRTWVAANPDKADDVLNQNASYVFFEEQAVSGAIGAQGVVLTAGRSLAVDRRTMPLGVPLWLEINNRDSADEAGIQRLMVAQDTGGAIVGAVRGDFFWGEGDEAGQIAGRMKDTGRYFVLLPKAVAARLDGGRS